MDWKTGSIAFLCGCAAMPALAQTDAPPPPSPPAIPDSGEIIVTAQRRDQKLRDVPISITALNSDMLVKSGVINTADLARITPGFTLQLYGNVPQPSIRGISSSSTGLGNSSNVAFYVDGVYQANADAQLMDLPDVQQVEILKGPQGTLYGQNAAGGAIIIHSIDPSFTATGKLSASYGSYDDKSFRGYVTGPVSDAVAVSLAGGYEDRDGFRRDILRGGRGKGLKSRLLRGKVLFKPTDTLSLTATGFYAQRKDGDVYAGVPIGPGTPLGYALADAFGVTIPKAVGPHQTATSEVPFSNITSYGFSLLGKLELGIGDLSTATSYDNVKGRTKLDIGYSAVNLGVATPDNDNHHFIQEVNFTSNKMNGLVVSAGAFYLNGKEAYVPQIFYQYYPGAFTVYPAAPVLTPPTPPGLNPSGYVGWNRKNSYAAYLELSYDVTQRLSVSVGGRYSYETQLVAKNNNYTQAPIRDLRGNFSFRKFTPRATARYALNDSSNVYATVSQGFKSGFIDADSAQVVSTVAGKDAVAPEVVTAYEIGYKGRLFDALSLNLSAFHYDYKKIQVFVYQVPTAFYQNAGAARINGLDFDASIKLTPQLSLSGGGAYIDAKYTKYPAAAVYTPSAFGFGNDFVQADAKGHRLPRTPKFSGNLALNYTNDTSVGQFAAAVSAAYNSGVTYDAIGIVKQGDYATLNGELSFAPSGLAGMRFVLWGKNLTNKAYLSGVLASNYANGATYAEPRTIGGRVELKF